MRSSVYRSVLAVRGSHVTSENREMVEEVEYTIHLNHRPVGRFSCSPWGIRQTAIGWLYLKGYLHAMNQLSSLEIREDSRSVLAETGVVPGPVPQNAPALCLKVSQISALSAMLEEHSALFKRTGGVHCAALADPDTFLAYEEDISRHAAVDKLAGACLENGIPMEGNILVFSGRVPGDIVRMASIMGCAMIIARSAPTDLACVLAEEVGITLIGFAREDGFNIYSCPHRVDLTNQ